MPHGASGKNNPQKSKVFGTNWLGKKRGEYPVLVTRISHPSPRLRVAGHPPSCKARHPPPGIHPRDTSRGARGRWAFVRPMRRIIVILSTLGRGALNHPGLRPPLRRGELFPRRYALSSPPLEGWWLAAGVVRECRIRHLIPCHSREGGNRAWVVLIILFGEYFSVVFFYSLVIRDMNLIDPSPAYAGMTKIIAERI